MLLGEQASIGTMVSGCDGSGVTKSVSRIALNSSRDNARLLQQNGNPRKHLQRNIADSLCG